MQQMTVKMLATHLDELLTKHPEIADKLIVISDDNEGNGYHGMFYGLVYNYKTVKETIQFSNGVYDSNSENPKDIVILG